MTSQQQFQQFVNHLCELSGEDELWEELAPLAAKLLLQMKTEQFSALDKRNDNAAILARQKANTKSRAQEAYVKFLPALEILYDVWGTDKDYVRPSEVGTTAKLAIEVNKAKLEDFKNFACSDATTYPGAIVGDKDAVIAKSVAYNTWASSHFDAEGAANAYGAKEQYSITDIRSGGGLIMTARSACCTTFALASAYVLTKGLTNYDTFRVECVAITKFHCFVVAGRKGGFVNGKGEDYSADDVKASSQRYLPPALNADGENLWGDDCYVIDAWYGSMGNQVIYASPFTNFPSQAQLNRLESKFDSKMRPAAVRVNPFAAISSGLNKASKGLKCPQCGGVAVPFESSAIPSGGQCSNLGCGFKGKRSLFF